MKHPHLKKLSRREFLNIVGLSSVTLVSGGQATFFIPLSAHLPEEVTQPQSRVLLHTFDPSETPHTQAVQEAFLGVTDLSWLRRGDSVFVKIACNSNRSHPAVTSPRVLEGVIQVLQEAGAGKIYVGDMSGAFFVRHLATETTGSTRENMRQTGLLEAAEAAGAEIHCFEEVPFEEAYVPGIPQIEDHHWGKELQVAAILDQVDHIINLPRLGKHALAGATMGLKNAIGWISDHSRMVLHRDAETFQEKIVEVNAIPQLAGKMRLTLTLVDQVLTTYGPDSGYHLPLVQPIILASEDVVSHDQVALLTLMWARTQIGSAALVEDPYPAQSNGMNWAFVRLVWGAEAAAAYHDLATFDSLADPQISTHINLAWETLRGGRPDVVEVAASGLPVNPSLVSALTQYPALGILLNDPEA